MSTVRSLTGTEPLQRARRMAGLAVAAGGVLALLSETLRLLARFA